MCLIFLPLNLTRHLTSEVKVYNKTYEVLGVGIEESLDAVEIGVEGVRKKRRTGNWIVHPGGNWMDKIDDYDIFIS